MRQLNHILLFALLMCAAPAGYAQLYGNEWIDYNKTYYKFSVREPGIYRIPKTALDAAGIPTTVTGAQLMLFRDGEEVPLYVTTNGVFSAGDYLEFFGTSAAGKFDKQLYADTTWHPNDRISMFSDTASYFLTYGTTGTAARYVHVPGNIPPTPPPPPTFCMVTSGQYYTNTFVPGRHITDPQNSMYLSLFDNGEGYVQAVRDVWDPTTLTLSTPNVTAGVAAEITISILRSGGNIPYIPINFNTALNGQQIATTSMPFDATSKINVQVSPSSLSTNNTFTISPVPASSYGGRYGIAFLEVRYPRDFNLSGLDYLSFTLLPSGSSQYLEIQDFNHGGSSPRLYDLTNRKWYDGDISQSGKTRFFLDPSFLNRDMVLYASGSSHIRSLSTSKTIQFTNFEVAAAQGNYILITHPAYMAITGGSDPIQDYRAYRSSQAGGGHQVVVADVTALYDQFAYGVNMHPLSIRNFLRFAYDRWTVRPEHVFMIGKGIFYHKYREYLQSPSAHNYAAIVPTYGDPGADIDFANFRPNRLLAMNVGRLNAWNPQEVRIYLERVKAYEASIKTPVLPTYETELWKKHVLHAAGGKDAHEQPGLIQTLNNGAAIIKDTAFGATISFVKKNTTLAVDQTANLALDSLINSGISIITFHGHSSPTGFEFNLNNPEQYKNAPRFSHFLALGCDVAQIFSFAPNKTISERYLINPEGASVSMLASNNPQMPDFHARYLPGFYISVSTKNYGKTIGDHHRFMYDSIRTISASDRDFLHIETLLLQGDPAIPVFGPSKPDYHVSSDRVNSIPFNVTTDLDSFRIRIVAYNLGRAQKDTVSLKVEHINPAGAVTTVKTLQAVNLFNTDTLYTFMPLNKMTDIGINRYKITIDPEGKFDEVSELNNTATLELFIYSDNLVPVYPPEFAIVHTQSVTLKASTLNPFRPEGRYIFEIDTTETFNSPLKQQATVTGKGGILRWTPGITLRDSVVYYWRTAFDSVINNNYQWANSSFIYLTHGSPGWNQSHYHQYLKNGFDSLEYGTDRVFRYPVIQHKITAASAVYDEVPGWPWRNAESMLIELNNSTLQRLGCPPWDGTLQIMVFDGGTGSVWKNDTAGTSGAYPICTQYTFRGVYVFEFPVWSKTGRDDIIHFLDSIPDGNFVLIRNQINLVDYIPSFIDDWKADTLINGSGQSLYHTLHNMGFPLIDSFYKVRPFLFFRKKNDNAYPVYQFAGADSADRIEEIFWFPATMGSGALRSPVIGPATAWDTLKWRSSAADQQPANDETRVTISGIGQDNIPVLLYNGSTRDTSLSFIDASVYPNLQMRWHSRDTVNRTSPQLDYWRILYDPVPEAALNPALHVSFGDSLMVGQMQDFAVAIENISDLPMDSMLVRYRLIDNNSQTHLLGEKRYKKLAAGDTLHAAYAFDSRTYIGRNVLFIEANPNKDQPEQYHPNNIGYIPFSVAADPYNPFIDVTFDGVHILNRDIVSAKPFIRILFKDENKYLKLDDTSLLRMSIRYPTDFTSTRDIPFDGTVCKFIPATDEKNEAVIEYRPVFTEDGTYELKVNGRDKSGNIAGSTDYEISFEVITRSTITNILNYPNPFSTSTAFVFTLTGSEIPTQFKIQIMTVTGKVVREITRQELGIIRIGRNVSEYKWDGKDQYGQMLGNGVYLYRVVTAINGKDIEHRSSGADKFYKNGYGKLYIMR